MFLSESLQSWSNMLVNENQLIKVGPQVSLPPWAFWYPQAWLCCSVETGSLRTSLVARLASSCQGLFHFLYQTLPEIPATD